jgi:hypothetical protein
MFLRITVRTVKLMILISAWDRSHNWYTPGGNMSVDVVGLVISDGTGQRTGATHLPPPHIKTYAVFVDDMFSVTNAL